MNRSQPTHSPFESGLLLEDSGLVLPWNATPKKLSKIGNPTTQEDKYSTRFFGSDRKLLNGLTGQVDSEFDHEPQTDRWNSGSLTQLEFYIYGPDDECPRDNYKRVTRHLIAWLGQPTSTETIDGRPIAGWLLGRDLLVYMVFDRFGEYCVGDIWRGPAA